MLHEDAYDPSFVEPRRDNLVVLSGCSGGGKSSLLSELARRGYAVVEEPGRQIVKEQTYLSGDIFPWTKPQEFVELCIARSLQNMFAAAQTDTLTFFDRSYIEGVNHFLNAGLTLPPHVNNALKKCRYNEKVFLVPPWREIYRTDNERQHSFEWAVAEYDSLTETFARLGYQVITVPKCAVSARADFVLAALRRA